MKKNYPLLFCGGFAVFVACYYFYVLNQNREVPGGCDVTENTTFEIYRQYRSEDYVFVSGISKEQGKTNYEVVHMVILY